MYRPNTADLIIAPLANAHDRAAFTCGVDSLDRYVRTQAGQDVRRKANAVFVMVERHDLANIRGYFTLAATALEQGEIPEGARKHLPRYPLVSATLLGRLAIASARQGQGLGAVLLGWALRKAYESAGIVGSSMLVVDAADERLVGFYEAHGFVRLAKSLRLAMTMVTIGRALE